MNVVDGEPYWRTLPRFLDKTEVLLAELRQMGRDELQDLWKCNDRLCDLNFRRTRQMDLRRNLTSAVISYEGIQYQHLAPHVMTAGELEYLEEHLRIVSGFYGLLRPMDGVTPYRLEMQARLAVGPCKNLYEFWGASLAEALTQELGDARGGDTGTWGDEGRVVVNLASVEYAKAVTPHLQAAGTRILTCLFGDVRDGRLVQRATEAKSARGSFVRWCAEGDVRSTREFRAFGERGYSLDEDLSDEDTLVFVRDRIS